jgi:hypothetical protein
MYMALLLLLQTDTSRSPSPACKHLSCLCGPRRRAHHR